MMSKASRSLWYLTVVAVLFPLVCKSQTAPVITSPPASSVCSIGSAASLSVGVSGVGVGFQWFKDSVRLLNQTNNCLSIDSFQITNTGSYQVVATNAYGMAISTPASLSVSGVSLMAWGRFNEGQLGLWPPYDNTLPTRVTTGVVAVAAGYVHTLFVKNDGSLWATGSNYAGDLGDGTVNNVSLPENVAVNVVAATAGYEHSLFIKADGSLWTMGWNYSGQLGVAGNYYNNNPVPQNVANGVVAAAAGKAHSLFLKSDGTLWAMGDNGHGQLGNGTNSSNANPIPAVVASNVVTIASGDYHSLFVRTDGTLWAMGFNYYGCLGNGTTADANRPVCVASNVLGVAAGYYHTLFIKADGTLWAMGANYYGQLGSGTAGNTNRPVFVASNVVEAAAGYGHSLFIKSDGTLWAAGWNNNGQLGLGTYNGTGSPVQVAGIKAAGLGASDEAYHSLTFGALLPQVSGLTNRNVSLGQTATFSASVTNGDGPFAYQWQFNGTNIANATNSSYTIAAAALSDAGPYTCVVAGLGGAVNKNATLIVFQPPQNFLAQSVSNRCLSLHFTGTPNYPYILQMATNLSPPVNWRAILTNPADANGSWQFVLTNQNGSRGFYRVLVQ